VELSQEFLIETFYSYCRRPLHKKYQNVFNAECPICKEGKSAGRSRRLFYFPHKEYLYCHNCVKSWKPIEWIKDVTHWTFLEIVKKNDEKKGESHFSIPHTRVLTLSTEKQLEPQDLPENSIDITDTTQVEFYKNNKYVKLALEYCKTRRLFDAVNGSKRVYLSLEDKVHKNRLVIPFYGNDGKIICYQTRALTKNQFPKYLTKFGEKELYGLHNIDCDVPYVFVFEGPIDSMFVKNGLAMASLAPTEKQMQQINNLIGYEQIWVFDNDRNNIQVQRKIKKYIREGKRIFIWPKEFAKFKDFNEICCALNTNEIPWKFVVKNSAKGQEALIKQTLVC
jgi:hypothetical protein